MVARARPKEMIITYVALYLIFASSAARAISQLEYPSRLPVMVGLLAFYLVLLLVEPTLIARNLAFLHVINGLQVAIGLGLMLFVDNLDYFSLLLIPPCTQSILHFRPRTALIWIGVTNVLMIAALLGSFPFSESIGYLIIYPTAIFFFTALSYFAKQAIEAQRRSEALLRDLQAANEKLKAYAAQVQELAAAEERNRLARELHDSVTQIIFGLTLSAQAARIMLDRDPGRVAGQLDHLQELAQNALSEMRALIQQLRPRPVTEGGLAEGLRRLAAERKTNDGLEIELSITGERRLPVKIEEELYHVAQEALNNIVKHAHTQHAVITLDMEDGNRVFMGIEDDGAGFEPAAVKAVPGHLGLTSMAERIQALGGSLSIDSRPQQGTRLRVELALNQEPEHA